MSKPKKKPMALGRYYHRVEARPWLRGAVRDGWYVADMGKAILQWRKVHKSAPSPYLTCRICGDHTLDPVLKAYRAKKDGTMEIGDMLDHSPESFATVPCGMCGGKRD